MDLIVTVYPAILALGFLTVGTFFQPGIGVIDQIPATLAQIATPFMVALAECGDHQPHRHFLSLVLLHVTSSNPAQTPLSSLANRWLRSFIQSVGIPAA